MVRTARLFILFLKIQICVLTEFLTTLWCPQDEALLDDIIDRLLEVRGTRAGKPVLLAESEVRFEQKL